MNKFLSVFGFDPAKHSVKTEMLAGLTTFLTMSYILAVNPIILSETGIMEGGRTGLTSFTVALLFLVALFFSPLFLMIPAAATTSALFLLKYIAPLF